MRAVLALQNIACKLTGTPFRTFLHPPRVMEELVRAEGFRLASRRTTIVWCADVYVRADMA